VREEQRRTIEQAGNDAFGLHPRGLCKCQLCQDRAKEKQAKLQLSRERNQADVIYFQLTDHWTDEEIKRITGHLSKLLDANPRQKEQTK